MSRWPAVIATLGLLIAAGCTADDTALQARLCAEEGDCPPGRACLGGVCVRPDDAQQHVVCRGTSLQTVRVLCDDYRCASARVEVLDEVDCAEVPGPVCNGAQSVRQRPGVCDPSTLSCNFPPPEFTECAGTRRRCEGDLLVETTRGGCDDETGECRQVREAIDCRDAVDATAARCASNRYLEQPVLAAGLPACDPQTTRCRVPEMQRVDCSADVATCDGAELQVQRGGACTDGACQYEAAEPVPCDAAPLDECDGDLLVQRAAGGICDPVAGACRYPEPTVEDCSRTVAECEGQTSVVREAGACVDGRCTVDPVHIPCDAPGPVACAPGSDAALLVQPAGVCEPVSGRCVTPEATIEPCPLERACADGVAVEGVPDGCVDGACVNRTTRTRCGPPDGFCRDGAAHNFDRPAQCDDDGLFCAGPEGPADRREPCPDELFCRGNVLFGPGDPNCAVVDGVAACVELPLLDCNRAPAPTCDGDRQVAHVGPGWCDAVLGCRFGEALFTDCAACLPAGAICVLPGTARLPPSAVDLGTAEAPLPARFEGALVMTTTEITRGDVQALIGQGHLPPILGPAPAGCADARCPATGLSWLDAVAIANARSARDGLPPCYDAAGRVIGGADGDPHLCHGWRLPTEAEWLWAWRGETRTRWPCGDDPACLAGWGEVLDGGAPSAVGQSRPSAAGVSDLGGNAREWVHDAFAPLTGGLDPHGPAYGAERVLRGGSWLTGPEAAESAARVGAPADVPVADAGLRLVRGLAPRRPSRCEIDPLTEQAFVRAPTGRGECALTPGVPCAAGAEETRRCPEGCRAGRCLEQPDAVIAALPDEDPEDPPDVLPVPLTFAAIPGGVFTHGGRPTRITHDFWLMTTELAYSHVLALDPDALGDDSPAAAVRARLRETIEAHAGCREDPPGCADIPVFGVTWLEMTALADALSAAEGLDPCYDASGAVVGGADGDPRRCPGYRLPTEAEWVYAARAGATTAWSCGDDPLCLRQSATFAANAAVALDDPGACPCRAGGCPLGADDGCRLPAALEAWPANPWGLYGMTGNVAEWVSDHEDGRGPAIGGSDPYRPPAADSRPVLKGGAWFEYSDALRFDARAVPDDAPFPAVGAGGRFARTIPAGEQP